MDVVQRIESHGSKSGKTSKEVRVMDCGEISAELIDGVSDTAKEVMRRQREEERAAALKTMLPGQEDPDAASARRLRELMEENKARFGRGYGSSSYDSYKKGDEPPVRGSGMAALASAHFEKPARGPEGVTQLAAVTQLAVTQLAAQLADRTMLLRRRLARRQPSIPPAATRAEKTPPTPPPPTNPSIRRSAGSSSCV